MRFGIFSDLRSVHLFLSGHFKRMLRGRGRVFGGEVPGKQFVDPVDRVLGDAGQDLAKISFRVQTVEFGGSCRASDYAEWWPHAAEQRSEISANCWMLKSNHAA